MSETTQTPTSGIADLLPEWNYQRLGLYFLVMAFFAFFVSPIWTGLVTSFKTGEAVAVTTPFVPPGPGQWTVNSWVRAFNYLAKGFVNSFLMAVPATLFDVLLGSTAAYGVTMVDWEGRLDKLKLPVLVAFLIGIFIPLQAVVVPLADFWTNVFDLQRIFGVLIPGVAPAAPFGLDAVLPFRPHHAELAELSITHIAYGIPICFLLFRSYYNTISDELLEAAKIDGASVTSTYLRIVLPLSKPMIGVVIIYQFTQIWNEFLFSLTLIQSQSDPAATLTLILSGIGTGLGGVNFPLRMAAAFLAALPTLLLYALFAEQFAEGLKT